MCSPKPDVLPMQIASKNKIAPYMKLDWKFKLHTHSKNFQNLSLCIQHKSIQHYCSTFCAKNNHNALQTLMPCSQQHPQTYQTRRCKFNVLPCVHHCAHMHKPVYVNVFNMCENMWEYKCLYMIHNISMTRLWRQRKMKSQCPVFATPNMPNKAAYLMSIHAYTHMDV